MIELLKFSQDCSPGFIWMLFLIICGLIFFIYTIIDRILVHKEIMKHGYNQYEYEQ